MRSHFSRVAGIASAFVVLAVAGCSPGASGGKADSAQAQGPGAAAGDSASMIAQNLMKFDTLDYVVFSHQQFDRFKESHAADITVTFPDGHETHGLPKHLEDMRAMFVPMPDLAITEHPIRIANGHWTAVTGRMTGTFTRPMPIGEGKTVPPTGKKLDLPMATIGHWTDAGVMDHEWLFWDNQAYMKQLGLAK
jgi:predicted ester cyclase